MYFLQKGERSLGNGQTLRGWVSQRSGVFVWTSESSSKAILYTDHFVSKSLVTFIQFREMWERVIIKFNTEIWCSACLITKWVNISPCGSDEPWWMTGPGPFTLWLDQSTLSNGQALVTHTQQIKFHQTWQLMSGSTVWLYLMTPCLLMIPENTSLLAKEKCLKNFYYH